MESDARTLSPAVTADVKLLASDVILRGATIVTMDDQIGDFARGDIRVTDGVIAAVGPELLTEGFTGSIVDAAGMIIAPGFHDSHRHCWQGVMRRLIPNVDDNEAYVRVAHDTLAQQYLPEDMFVGNKISALGCLDAGITTVMDFSHNSRSDEHADAAVEGLIYSGIRAVHANCAPVRGDFSARWPRDLERLSSFVSRRSSDRRVTLRLGALGSDAVAGGTSVTLSRELIELARSLDLGVTTDGVLGLGSSEIVASLARDGVLGPDVLLIHCTDMQDAAWQGMADSGAQLSLAPTSDAQIGIAAAIPPIQKALDFGIEPALSVDVEIALSTDMFSQMRMVLTTQRMLAFKDRYDNAPKYVTGAFDEVGVSGYATPITSRDVLRYATINGARANGLEDVSGSLTPGKRADLIGIRADAINNLPLNSAIGTIVSGTDVGNIQIVLVDGHPMKWAGQLVGVDVDAVRAEVESSRDRLLGAAGVDLDILSA